MSILIVIFQQLNFTNNKRYTGKTKIQQYRCGIKKPKQNEILTSRPTSNGSGVFGGLYLPAVKLMSVALIPAYLKLI